MRTGLLTMMLILLFAPVGTGQDVVVFSEDFEAGLGDWTTNLFTDPGADNENVPHIYDATGNNITDAGADDMYGNNDGAPASRKAGFSTNIFPAWDGINPQWMQRQFAAAVPPGTYDVTITSDRYMWWCRAWEGANCYDSSPTWQAGNQILVLTDDLYDDALAHLEDSLGTSGMRRTMWTRPSENGNPAWDTRTDPGDWIIGYTDTAQITTTTGDLEIRLQLWEKSPGQLTAAWDNLTIHLVDINDPGNTWTLTEDFEGTNPLADWEYKLPGLFGQIPVFQEFATDDAALYDNVNNPGSTSAGYSNDYDEIGGFNWFWAHQLFPGTADPGVLYTARLEFDRYVYWQRYPLVIDPMVYPDAGSMYGANVGHNGSPCVGFENDQPSALNYDAYVWIHQFIAAADSGLEPAETYDLNVQARIYVEDDPAIGDWNVAGGIALATDTAYTDPDSLGNWRTTRWANQGGDSGQGSWYTVNVDYTDVSGFMSPTGDLDIVLFWREKSGATLQRIVAFDDIVLTFKDQTTAATVYTFSDDFNGVDPLTDWETDYKNDVPQPFAVGNFLHVITDGNYDDPAVDPEEDMSPGFSVGYWDGFPDVTNNGVWVHEVVEQPFSTSTGDVEVRLSYRMKEPFKQVVAWDNVSLTLIPPAPVCNNPELRFDQDNDGDVDGDDFAFFQLCHTDADDPLFIYDAETCRCMNSDGDLDIDSADFNAFLNCANTSGPDVPADIACDDGLADP